MQSGFIKTKYDCSGFYLTHTVGVSAEGSTHRYPHNITSCLLYFFMRGSGNIKVEGKQYPIVPGDMILLNPSELFCCTVDDTVFHERCVVHFDHDMLHALPYDNEALLAPFFEREKGSNNRIPAAIVSKFGADTAMLELLELLKSEKPCSQTLAYCKMVEVFGKIADAAQAMAEEQYEEPLCENALIARVLQHLNQNYTADITIDEVAKEFFINKSYLSHLFREYVGMPLWTYVILRRLNRFNELVAGGETVEHACRQVGFQNYSNFFRLYKKYMNMTPSQFKAQSKGRHE